MTTTYDSAIDTLMGDKLMLFVTDGSSTLPIAFGTSCNIDLSADTVDTSNKMSGNWKEFLTGQLVRCWGRQRRHRAGRLPQASQLSDFPAARNTRSRNAG